SGSREAFLLLLRAWAPAKEETGWADTAKSVPTTAMGTRLSFGCMMAHPRCCCWISIPVRTRIPRGFLIFEWGLITCGAQDTKCIGSLPFNLGSLIPRDLGSSLMANARRWYCPRQITFWFRTWM